MACYTAGRGEAWFSAHGLDPIRAALSGRLRAALYRLSPGGDTSAWSHQSRGLAITQIGELTPSRDIVLAREGGRAAGRLHPLRSDVPMVRPRARAWLEQLLHTHDTPQRTAAAYALGVLLGFSPLLDCIRCSDSSWRLRSTESRCRPAWRLLESSLDPRPLLHAEPRGLAHRSGTRRASRVVEKLVAGLEHRSWSESSNRS